MIKYFLSLLILVLFASCDTEPNINNPDNALPGLFSVSSIEQVRFSPGNLQYQASTNMWRFAINQYDIVGVDNANIAAEYDGWIDLFGWATSGYNGCMPYFTSTDPSIYGKDVECIGGTKWDWGICNPISNAGDKSDMWRLLSKEEWEYILKKRENASELFGIGCVNDVNGLILLPDDCVLPAGISFHAEVAGDSGSDLYRKVNNFTLSEWNQLEAIGVVFIPAAGARLEKKVTYVGIAGYYWSDLAFEYDDNNVYCMGFDSSRVVWEGLSNRTNGRSVRLVRKN